MTEGGAAVVDRAEDSASARALGVEVEIVPERGQWAVDIIVIFADGVVRRRVQTYRTERLATISAGCIKRGAERDVSGPING